MFHLTRFKHSKLFFFRKELQTVFASASCLNASFLDKEKHYSTSNKYPGIDLAKAKDIYNLLNGLNDQFLNELVLVFF